VGVIAVGAGEAGMPGVGLVAAGGERMASATHEAALKVKSRSFTGADDGHNDA